MSRKQRSDHASKLLQIARQAGAIYSPTSLRHRDRIIPRIYRAMAMDIPGKRDELTIQTADKTTAADWAVADSALALLESANRCSSILMPRYIGPRPVELATAWNYDHIIANLNDMSGGGFTDIAPYRELARQAAGLAYMRGCIQAR